VTMTNAVFWDLTPCVYIEAGFEVSTAVTMTSAVFWDVATFGFIVNRLFGGTCALHLQHRRGNAGEEKCSTVTNRLTSVRRH
jgi:hypothetical protein